MVIQLSTQARQVSADTVSYVELDPLQRPLLAKFYREQGSKMSGAKQTAAWVAKNPDIVASLCLSAIEQGHWLTGLVVAANFRQQGIATLLLKYVRQNLEGPIWLFCKPELAHFYAKADYRPADALPAVLTERLQRYQKTKDLIALVNKTSTCQNQS